MTSRRKIKGEGKGEKRRGREKRGKKRVNGEERERRKGRREKKRRKREKREKEKEKKGGDERERRRYTRIVMPIQLKLYANTTSKKTKHIRNARMPQATPHNPPTQATNLIIGANWKTIQQTCPMHKPITTYKDPFSNGPIEPDGSHANQIESTINHM